MEYSTSEIVATIELPTKIITGISFGGPDMNELLVMTGTVAYDLHTGTRENSTDDALFIIKNLNVKGMPGNDFILENQYLN